MYVAPAIFNPAHSSSVAGIVAHVVSARVSGADLGVTVAGVIEEAESKGTGQAWMLQFAVVLPTHVAPPFSGAGLEHVRDIDPVPQVLEHAPYTDHPPLTGAGTGSGT